MSPGKVCFFDAGPIGRSTNVTRVVHQGEKHPDNPVLTGTKPWEVNRTADGPGDGSVYLMGTVLYDADTDCYRMWYRTYPPSSDPLTLYAESDDGLEWRKPELGTFERDGSTANNIVGDFAKLPAIVRDPDPADPARTYKWFSYHHRGDDERPGNLMFYSPDGINWTEYGESPAHTRDLYPNLEDASSAFYDPYADLYIGTAQLGRPPEDFPTGAGVYTTTSSDFVEWSPPKPALIEDARDRELVEANGGDRLGYYYLTGLAYEDLWLGFAHLYQIGATDGLDGGDGPIDPRLAISRDEGDTWEKTWHETDHPEAIIPRGPPGSFDHGMIFTASQPIVRNDEIRVYYGGISKGHGSDGGDTRAIGLATWPLDRFISYRSTGGSGTITTVQMTVTGGDLLLNADPTVRGRPGSVRVEVLQPGIEVPIRGYTRDACVSIESDGLRQPVRWNHTGSDRTRNLDRLVGRNVRFRIYLENSDLYTLSFT